MRWGARQQRRRWPRWDQLDRYGYDLTARLDERPEPLADRDGLNQRVAAALLRRDGANAIITGPGGAGKRSAVAALAQAISAGHGPNGLQDRQIYALDARRLMAGTRFRGDLDTRLARVGAQVAAGRGRIAVALDHAELLVTGEGGPGAAAVVSELLSTGGWLLPLTPEAMAVLIQDLPDSDRLLQVIELPEWTDRDAARAAAGWMPALAGHHGITFVQDAADLAVRMARRYLTGQSLPGAAVTLLDAAAARERTHSRTEVDRTALLAVVAERTGLPLVALQATSPSSADQGGRWHDVEGTLAQRVVGQPQAVRAVAAALRRARAGIGDAHRPLGCFLFVGPTGVGKTELARAIAEFLFGDEDLLVRVDMSEYQERHSVARLIGAPPGYVGFELPGQLTDPVRRRPFSVVLFDEAEKAHPDVLNLLLQVFEDGRLTDGYGRTVDFRHTVVVLTSNAGSVEAKNTGPRARAILLDAARRLLRPELLNRLDDIVAFDPLSEPDMARIVDLQLSRANTRLEVWGLRVRLTAAAHRALARKGYDPEYGARPIRRLIEREVLDPIAAALLGGGTGHGAVEGVLVDTVTEERTAPDIDAAS